MERSSDFRDFACQFRVQGGSPKTLPEKSSIFHDVKSEKNLGKRLPWRKQSISCSSSKLSALSALSELRKNVAVFFLKESLREKKGAKRACRGVKSNFQWEKGYTFKLLTYAIKVTVSVLYWYEKLSSSKLEIFGKVFGLPGFRLPV